MTEGNDMRVGVVTPWFPSVANPASGAFVLKDCQAFVAAGIDVRVIHLIPPSYNDGVRHLTQAGIKVLRIPLNTKDPASWVKAHKHLKVALEGFDIVHTQAISALLPFLFGRPKQPWIHTEHWSGITNPLTLPALWRNLLPLLLKLEKLPDIVVAVCEYLATPLRKIRSDRPVEIIPCQVPAPDQLKERPPRTAKLRLVSTGALVERKDPLLAIRTLAVLRERGVEASLVWLGEGGLRKQVQNLTQELGVEASFPGTANKAGVQQELAAADMFFGPTRGDNFFVAAAEAIVNGRPLVVGANGGQGEYINPQIGRLVNVQDPEHYATAIIDLWQSAQGWTAAEIAATVGDRFEPQTIANSYRCAYEKLCAMGGNSCPA